MLSGVTHTSLMADPGHSLVDGGLGVCGALEETTPLPFIYQGCPWSPVCSWLSPYRNIPVPPITMTQETRP